MGAGPPGGERGSSVVSPRPPPASPSPWTCNARSPASTWQGVDPLQGRSHWARGELASTWRADAAPRFDPPWRMPRVQLGVVRYWSSTCWPPALRAVLQCIARWGTQAASWRLFQLQGATRLSAAPSPRVVGEPTPVFPGRVGV